MNNEMYTNFYLTSGGYNSMSVLDFKKKIKICMLPVPTPH